MTALAELRTLCPPRPLVPWEARGVAERQASRLLRLQGVTEPPIPEQVIECLPRVRVEYVADLPSSGAVRWDGGAWLILVNASEAWVRQRFSLAHEFHHIIAAPAAHRSYGRIRRRPDCRPLGEQAADAFAASLLMPRAWVKRAYYDLGVTDERALARRFDVSVPAMRVRIAQLGLRELDEVAA